MNANDAAKISEGEGTIWCWVSVGRCHGVDDALDFHVFFSFNNHRGVELVIFIYVNRTY